MNRILRVIGFCLGLLCVVSCTEDSRVRPLKPIRVTTGDWEPYVGSELPRYGPVAEMVSQVFADCGYVPQFSFYDWEMVEMRTIRGRSAIAFPFVPTEDRKAESIFTKPLLSFDYVLFYHVPTNDTAPSVRSLAELKGKKVGLIRGYARLPNLEAEYVSVRSAQQGFDLLRRKDSQSAPQIDYLREGRIAGERLLQSAAFPDDKDDFRFLGQQRGPSAEEDPNLFGKLDLCIMISKKAGGEDLATELNKHIPDLSEDMEADHQNGLFFRQLRERLSSDGGSGEKARLMPLPGESHITAILSSEESRTSLHLPAGTSVLVVQWASTFRPKEPGSVSSSPVAQTSVKILNGPWRGKVVEVDTGAVHLTDNS